MVLKSINADINTIRKIKALLRLGVAWNILLACDRTTADFILTSPLMHDEYEIMIPDYCTYMNRKVTG